MKNEKMKKSKIEDLEMPKASRDEEFAELDSEMEDEDLGLDLAEDLGEESDLSMFDDEMLQKELESRGFKVMMADEESEEMSEDAELDEELSMLEDEMMA